MRVLRWMLFPVLVAVVAQGQANGRSQSRSMTISDFGIAATSQTLASQAGAQILARGGSAVDAAIASNAALAVVEPYYCGLGGDLFAIEWDAKTGKLSALDASGWAPSGLSIDALKAQGHATMPQFGILSVTVPGMVEGWTQLHQRFGKLPWADLFQPAIYFAEHGFPVTEVIRAGWQADAARLARDPNASKVFLVNGAAPPVGTMFRNPEMGAALQLIAAQGESAYYKGAIARAILKTSTRLGGTMTAADLADYRAEWVQPISTDYHGWKVFELPPSTQGFAALEMLNIMSRFPLASEPSRGVEELHTEIEAQKLAYQDLRRYDGDPRMSKIPVEAMISPAYAATRAALIDPNHASCEVAPGQPVPPGGDTIYLSTVDHDGNIVSLIQSLFQGFGSGVVVDDYGFALQDRGALFNMQAGHPDAVAPHKHPLHTLIPAFMENGDLHVGFGIMGGYNQAQAHAQFISNIVDHGMNIQAALDAPRFTKQNFRGCDVEIEDRVAPDVRAALTARGHVLRVLGDYAEDMGGGQVVMHDSTSGVNFGASDPRKDGAAIPEPAPYFKH